MTEKQFKQKVHSEDYFGETRNFWWNIDFLQLMGKRLHFDQISSVLDVGCGIGHWGQILSSVLPDHVELTGVDLEERSIQRAIE